MFARRHLHRRSTWAVLVAFVLSTFAIAPFAPHAHASGPSFHTDLCRSIAAQAGGTATVPLSPQNGSHAANGCSDCAWCGGGVALTAPIAPWLAFDRPAELVVAAKPLAPRHHELLSPAPRGPPFPV